MRRNVSLIVLAGLGAAALAGCAAPRQYPDRNYYEAPPDRASYEAPYDAPAGYTPPATTRTTETTTTYYGAPAGTMYRQETVTTYDAYGKPVRYVEDDPHHYGRGPNYHKY